MNPEQHRLSAEIAHVLFMDMVDYSRGSMEEQARLAHELRTVVRGTPEFQRAEVMVAPSLQTEGKDLQRSQGVGMGH